MDALEELHEKIAELVALCRRQRGEAAIALLEAALDSDLDTPADPDTVDAYRYWTRGELGYQDLLLRSHERRRPVQVVR